MVLPPEFDSCDQQEPEDYCAWWTYTCGNTFPEAFHYPHRIGVYRPDDVGPGEEPVYPPGDQTFFVTVIDEIDGWYDPAAGSDYAVRSRRVVEMNPRGYVLRDRTWKQDEDGLALESQYGFSEVRKYDEKGRVIQRRTAGWDSMENPDQTTKGLVYTYEYDDEEPNSTGELAAVGIQSGACDPGGTCDDPTVYYLERYEHANADRPDLLTLAEKFAEPTTDAQAGTGAVTRWIYTLGDATPGNESEKPVVEKAVIGPPALEGEGGLDPLYPLTKQKYDDNGNEIASGAGYTSDPEDPTALAHRFYANYAEYDSQGRPTSQITDVDTSSIELPADFPDYFDRQVPAEVDNPPLDLTTTLEYDPTYGLRKIIMPNGREQYIVYVENPPGGQILEQWIYKDVVEVPVGSGTWKPLSPVELNQFVAGQLQWKKKIRLAALDHHPPTGSETFTDDDVISTETPEYDENGRLISVEQTGSDVTESVKASILYDSYGQIWRQRAPDGTISRYVYDQLGRLQRVFRGTNDTHEYWGSGVTCDELWECDYAPANCYCPGDFPDDLVLLEKRAYGTGFKNANLLTDVWRFRQQPDNQYLEVGLDGQEPPDYPPPPPDNNEDDLGWLTRYEYDWRMRQAKVIGYNLEGQEIHHSLTWYDHLDRVLLSAEYGDDFPDGVDPTTISAGDSSAAAIEGVLATIFDATLKPLSLDYNIYNDRGQVTETRRYDVENSTYSDPKYTSTRTYYDHVGREVEIHTSNASVQRYEYDAKGRLILSWTEVDGTQLVKSETTFDDNDRAVSTSRYERGAGATGDELDYTNSVISYSYTWYDKAGKIVARADFGTDSDTYATTGDTPPLLLNGEGCTQPCYDPASPPESADTYPAALITLYEYDDAGRQVGVIDPGGIKTKTEYDGLGRVVMVTENAAGDPADQRHTAYKYDVECVEWDEEEPYPCVRWEGSNLLVMVAAVMPDNFGPGVEPLHENINWEAVDGSIQVTRYVYEAQVVQSDGGSGYEAVSENRGWISAVHYPDADTGQPEVDPSITFTYRPDGKVVQRTDARNVILTYDYDEFDRLASITADCNSAPDVDTTAAAMSFAYTAGGLLTEAEVLDGSQQTLNRASFTYGGFAQLESATQQLTGVESEKTVSFAWDSSTADDYFRLTGITYPGEVATTVGVNYGAAGSIDDKLSRLISYDTGDPQDPLVAYRHMGEGRRVGLNLRNGVSRDYDDGAGGAVTRLDGFGRVIDIPFDNPVEEVLRYEYGYDKRGNKTFARIAHQGANQSWLYGYDGLNRLIRASQGTLNGVGDGFIGDTPQTRRWQLDTLGNWSAGDDEVSVERFLDADDDGVYDEGTGDTMLATIHHNSNALNQIASRVTGDESGTGPALEFAYDQAGNLIFDGRQYYVYDAWNRLVAVYESGTLYVDEFGNLLGLPGDCLTCYEYDALNRRVRTVEHPGDSAERKTMHVYAGGAQCLAEYDVTFSDTGPLARWFVHGESFPDPLVMVDVTGAGDEPAGVDEYLYYLKDALGSTGALANAAGAVVERYVYTPYGQTMVLTGDAADQLPAMEAGYYFDHDLDGDIELADEDDLYACLANTPGDPLCVFAHDYTGDGMVDFEDAGIFADWIAENEYGDPPPAQWLRGPRAIFDANGDEAIDLYDFTGLEECFDATGALCLNIYDLDGAGGLPGDGTIDLADYAAFTTTFTGPNTPVPFAGTRSAYGNPFLWTGQRYDAVTGLYLFVYRAYDPVLGRFLQKDMTGPLAGLPDIALSAASVAPWLEESSTDPGAEYSDGLSLYRYVESNPINRFDALGLWWDEADDLADDLLGHKIGALALLNSGAKWASLGLCTASEIAISLLPGYGIYQAFKSAVEITRSGRGGLWDYLEIGLGAMSSINPIMNVARAVGKTGRILTKASLWRTRMRAGEKVGGFFRKFTQSQFAHNLKVLTGHHPGAAFEAHHVLPMAHVDKFKAAGIGNIHKPVYGAWWAKRAHRTQSYQYGKEWEKFFNDPGSKTRSEVLSFARKLAADYGFTVEF